MSAVRSSVDDPVPSESVFAVKLKFSLCVSEEVFIFLIWHSHEIDQSFWHHQIENLFVNDLAQEEVVRRIICTEIRFVGVGVCFEEFKLL